jgi:phosphonate utilization associated putative membrane protein
MSVVIHIAYYAALAGAYKHGDLGLSYPLMRGIGPVLVALGSVVCLGESLSVMSWMGVFCVCLGGLMLGLSPLALQQPTAIRFALVNACVIACYTVVDALGARAAVQAGGSALQYVALLFVLDGWPFAMLVLKRRGLCVAWVYARARAPLASFGAIASLGSYSIALWAMTKAPVATVAALRETSVVFAALLGSCLLKEALTVQRAMAILITLAGVIALRVG